MPPNIFTTLADNPALFEAVKKALIDEFHVVESEGGMSDERLGQMYRARIIGVQTVEKVFKDIAKLKSPTPNEPRMARHR